jgi:hypothetical protein
MRWKDDENDWEEVAMANISRSILSHIFIERLDKIFCCDNLHSGRN